MRFAWWTKVSACLIAAVVLYVFLPDVEPISAQDKVQDKKDNKKKKGPDLEFPPRLPDGKEIHTVTSDEFLKAPATIDKDVLIAKTAPTIDFLYYPCQTYKAKI